MLRTSAHSHEQNYGHGSIDGVETLFCHIGWSLSGDRSRAFLNLRKAPSPLRHVSDDGLSALVHRDVLNNDLLLASGPVTFERLHLRRKRPRELVGIATSGPNA